MDSSHPQPLIIPSRPRADVYQRFEFIYPVGQGTYGMVYKGEEKVNPGNKVAIKKFHGTKEGEGISLTAYREIGLLRELKHENIIRLQDTCLNARDKSLYLVYDYCEYDLFGIIKYHRDHGTTPPESMIKSIVWQMLNGMHYLHSNWVIHRDLKPYNILVMGEGKEPGVVKIGDFGLARVFQSPLRPLNENGVVVTIWYRAPELLLGSKHYTRAVDIWAIGCIFAELLTTRPLFPGNEKDLKNPALFQDDQVDKIIKVLGKPTIEEWPSASCLPEWKRVDDIWRSGYYPQNLARTVGLVQHSAAYELLQRMILYDPSRRITAEEALDHPYFQQAPLPSLNCFNGLGNIPYPQRQPLVQAGTSSSSSSAGGGASSSSSGRKRKEPLQ